MKFGITGSLFLLITATAAAQNRALVTWSNPAGGLWSVGANWSGGTPPNVDDDVVIDLGATLTVTLDVDIEVFNLTIGGSAGIVTFNASGRMLDVGGTVSVMPTGQLILGSGAQIISGTRALPPPSLQNSGMCTIEDSQIGIDVNNMGSINIYGTLTAFNGNFANQAGAMTQVLANAGGNATPVFNGPSGFQNMGNLVLSSLALGQSGITAAAGFANIGVLNVNLGSGGGRFLDADLNNDGNVNINADFSLARNNANHVNTSTGVIRVNAGTFEWRLNDMVPEGFFTNDGGIGIAAGAMVNVFGGNYMGTGILADGSLKRQPPAGGQISFYATLIDVANLVNDSVTMALIGVNLPVTTHIDNQATLKFLSANMIGGTVSNTSSGEMIIEGGFGDGTATFTSTFTNDGTIRLDSLDGTDATLEVLGASFINQAGALLVSEPGAGGNRTIKALVDNSGDITVNQTLRLDVPGTVAHVNRASGMFDMSPGTALVVQMGVGGRFDNDGTLAVANATINMTGGTFNPNAGTIDMFEFRKLGTPAHSMVLNMSILGTGSMTNTASMEIIDTMINGTLINQGVLDAKGNNTVNGTFTNEMGATLRVLADAAPARFRYVSGAVNDGDIELTSGPGTGDAILEVTAGVLTNNGMLVSLPGVGGMRRIEATLDNQNAIDVSAPLVLSQPATAAHSNAGNIIINNGPFDISLDNDDSFINSGNIDVGSGQAMTLTGGLFNLGGGTVTTSFARSPKPDRVAGADPLVRLENTTVANGTFDNVFLMELHDVTFDPGANLSNQYRLDVFGTNAINGTFANTGASVVRLLTGGQNSTLTLASGFVNAGLIDMDGDAVGFSTLTVSSGQLTNGASGTISAVGTGAVPRQLNCRLVNDGQLIVAQPLDLNGTNANHTSSNEIFVQNGATLRVIDATLGSLTNTGVLRGNLGTTVKLQNIQLDNLDANPAIGVLRGQLNIDTSLGSAISSARIQPGDSPGIMTVLGDFTFQPTNILTVEIGGLIPGMEYDQFNGFGILTLDGDLDLIFVAGFQPNPGDTFTIASFNSITGDFANINGSVAPNGLTMVPTLTPTSYTLTAVSADSHWIGPGNDWQTAANWDTGMVPGPTSNVFIDLPGTYEVQLSASVTILSLHLGAASGIQTLKTLGHDISVGGPSQILPNGILEMAGSDLGPAGAPRKPGEQFGGGGLANDGTLVVTSLCNIDVPFSNNVGGLIEIRGIGNPSPDHALLHTGGFVNSGVIELTSVIGPADAGLEVAGNLLIASTGSFFSSTGTLGNRTLMGQINNQGDFHIEQDLMVDANSALAAKVAELVQTGQGTLAKYSFEGRDGDIVADGSLNELHGHNEGTRPVPGVFGKARYFDGVDDFIEIEGLTRVLEQAGKWTVEYLGRAGDEAHALVGVTVKQGLTAPLQPTGDRDWHYFATTYDGVSLRYYRDGVLLASSEVGDDLPETILIGREGDDFASGMIDELKISAGARGGTRVFENWLALRPALMRATLPREQRDEPAFIWVDGYPARILSSREPLTLRLPGHIPGADSDIRFVTLGGENGSFDEPILTEVGHEVFSLSGTRKLQRGVIELRNSVTGKLSLEGGELQMTAGSLVNDVGAVLEGDGTVFIQPAAMTNNGAIRPGTSPGAIGFNELPLGPNGFVDMEISGLNAGSQYDQIAVSGTLTMGGHLNVNLAGFTPSVGDRFELFTFNLALGNFATISLPTPGGGMAYQTVLESNAFVLEVVSGPISPPQLFISDVGNNRILALDIGGVTVNDSIVVGTTPRQAATTPGGSKLYVPNGGAGTVSVIDTNTNNVLTTIPGFSNPRSVTFNGPGTEAWVSELGGIQLVDTASDTRFQTITDPCLVQPTGLVYNRFQDETYSIDASGQVCIVNNNSKTVTGSVPVAGSPQYGALTPDGSFLYVSNLSGSVIKINTVTKMTTSIGLGSGMSTGLATDGLKVLVAMQNADLGLIDVLTDTPGVVTFPATASFYDVAIVGTRAYLTDQTNAQLHAVDLLTYMPDPLMTALPGSTPREITSNTLAVNPPGTLQFSQLSYSAPEFNGGPVALSVQIVRIGGSAGPISARFQTQDFNVGPGFATADVDYDSVDSPIFFADGDTTPQTVNVLINDDRLVEGDEIAGLLLVPDIVSSKFGGTLDTATFTIQDVEEGTLDFTMSNYATSEPTGSVTLTVTRSNGTDGMVQVNYQTVNGTATAGTDFTLTTGTLTFPAGSGGSQNIMVPITADTDLEGSESFQVLLDMVTNNAALGLNNPATVTIADSPGTVAFISDPYVVGEGDGNAVIGFQRVGGSGGMISAGFATANGTAMEPGDYGATTGSIDLMDGELTQSILVPIVDDPDPETNESVNLSLMNGATTSNATLVIVDNDGVTNPGMVRFTSAAYQLPEAGTVVVAMERIGGTDGAVSFTLMAAGIPGGATPGVDFNISPMVLQFPDGGAGPIQVSLNAINDSMPEDDEDFQLNLTSPTGGLTLGNPNSVPVTILDDDQTAGSLQLSAAQYAVPEPNGMVSVGVTRTGGTDGMVAVTLSTQTVPGGASAGADYTPVTTQVSFNDGEAGTKMVPIPIIDDAIAEGNEVFQVALANPAGGATLGVPATAQVTIQDDEQPDNGSFRFETANLQVAEDEGSVALRVLRVGGSGGNASVTVSTVAGSADPSDFGATPQTITFADGDSAPKTVLIPIVNDDLPETRESFEAVLGNPTGGAGLAAPNRATIEIFDNDATLVSWQLSASPVQESDRVMNVVAELDSPSDARIFVDVTITGTAVNGVDYVLNNPTMIFPPGTLTAAIALRLIDDNLVEPTESIGLTLRPRNAASGSPSSHNITITDNDQTQVAWNVAQRTVTEGQTNKANTTVSVLAVLSKPIQGGISVPVQVSGTAGAGSDYQLPANNVLVFPDGEDTATYDFLLFDDQLDEGPETLVLQMEEVEGLDLGANDQITVTIRDDDAPVVFWALPAQAVEEDDAPKRSQTISAEARLSNPSTRRLITGYVVAGNATFGADHNLTAGQLVFEPGSTSATLSFQVLGDLIEEHDEAVLVNLVKRDVRVVNGQRRIHRVRIRDNDRGQAPQTQILAPSRGSQWLIGQDVPFLAQGNDPQGDEPLDFRWEICSSTGNCVTRTGAELNDLSFTAPGRYMATCIARDDGGSEDLTPATVHFDVRSAISPRVVITEPAAQNLNITNGTHVIFSGEVTAPGMQKADDPALAWFFIGNPAIILGTTDTYEQTFDQPGDFTLVFQADDGTSPPGRDFINIHVAGEMPVVLGIASPTDGQIIQVGDEVTFNGLVDEGTGKAAGLRFFWVPGDGSANLPGRNPAPFTYQEPGQYVVRFFAVDTDGIRYCAEANLEVRDSQTAPLVEINLATDLAIEPGGPGKRADADTVFLAARVRDSRGFGELCYFWDINGERFHTSTPGRRTFSEPGVYTVSLFAVTPDGMESETATRTITVRESDDAAFEPNDQLSEAAEITSGVYDNLVVDDDYFRITVPASGQRLQLKLNAGEPVRVEVYDEEGGLVASREIPAQDNLQLEGLAAGDYFIRIRPGAAGKTGFGYSFGISVLDPALYFADIQVNESMDTQLGVVNPTGSLATISFIGYDANGDILGEMQLELEPRGRSHRSVAQLFGDVADRIAWVQVDADHEVTGYARTESRDRKEIFGVSANSRLSSELHVPHIAERTEQWFTRASVINGGDAAADSMIVTPGENGDLFLDQGFVKDSFDFLDRFGGTLPQGAVWATFKEVNENPVLAGTEIFGLLDPDARVIAGLSLADSRKDNPNFTYIGNNLYFTHISRDPNFFTGLALVNIGTSTQGVILHAYGDGGVEMGQPTTFVLAENEKLVRTATDLLAGIADPAAVDWILIEADLDVVGYELFGTVNNTSLAGLEASTALRSELCYPFIDSDSAVAHGISVINVNAFPIVVTFTLYEDNGAAIGSLDVPLNGHEKFIGVIGDMFAQELNGADRVPGWMGAAAHRGDGQPAPLAGFELFIKDEQMGAVIAQ